MQYKKPCDAGDRHRRPQGQEAEGERSGQGNIGTWDLGKVSTGGKGKVTPTLKFKYYFAQKTGAGAWTATEPEEKVISLGEMDCPETKDFQEWFSLDAPAGAAKTTVSYRLYVHISSDCEVGAYTRYLKFVQSYGVGGVPDERPKTDHDLDDVYVLGRKEGTDQHVDPTTKHGWTTDGKVIAPPK